MTHPSIALHLSGGKDSLLALYLNEYRWNQILVCWLNTGAAFPETIAFMERIREKVPNFLEIKTDVRADISKHGLPTDVLPFSHTSLHQTLTGWSNEPKLRHWANCCMRNIWSPMNEAMKLRRIKTIIRGTKKFDKYIGALLRDGLVIDGITYRFPLWEYSDPQVFAALQYYKQTKGIEIPATYDHLSQSPDCSCCTAYLDQHREVINWMKKAHPDEHRELTTNLDKIRDSIDSEMNHLDAAIGGF